MRALRDAARRAKQGPKEVGCRMPAAPEGYHVGCQKRIVWAPAAEAGDALAFWYHTYALREHEGEKKHLKDCIATAEESPERNNALPALIGLLRERGLRSACSYIRRAAGPSFMRRFVLLTRAHVAEAEKARSSYAEYLRKERCSSRKIRRRLRREFERREEKYKREEARKLAEREEVGWKEELVEEKSKSVTRREGKKKEAPNEENKIYGVKPEVRRVPLAFGGSLRLIDGGRKSLAETFRTDPYFRRRPPP